MAGLEKTVSAPAFDTSYPALIVKANRGVIHHGAVGIARTLGRTGVPVYAVVDDQFTPLARSRYVARAFVWKNWPYDREPFLQDIAEVAAAIGRTAVIYPIDDLAAALVAENAEFLRSWFLVPHLPPGLPRKMGDKGILYAWCRQIGVPCAQSTIPKCERDIDNFVRQVGFPVVMKATNQWAPINGYASTLIVHDNCELQAFHEGAKQAGVVPMVLQEFLPGEDWIYHGYRNASSNICVSFTGRKLLSYPLSAGPTVVGVSEHNEALVRQSESLLGAIGFSGIIDMDWRLDARDGQFKILDCNPRVGQNFRMFVDKEAVDVVRAQYRDLTGMYVAPSRMAESRVFIVEPYYTFLRLKRQDKGAVSQTRTQKRELAWFATDDPLPAIFAGLRLLQRMALRKLQ
jgi:D-aspartate ligase